MLFGTTKVRGKCVLSENFVGCNFGVRRPTLRAKSFAKDVHASGLKHICAHLCRSPYQVALPKA